MNWSIITGVVAVYGALLSTWNAVAKHLENRARIKVKISVGIETFGPDTGPISLMVTALNNGQQAVTLVSAGLRLPDKRTTHHFSPSGTASFPHELQRGQKTYLAIPIQEVARTLKGAGFSGTIKVKGYFRDALDKTYTSNAFKLDVEKLLKD